jgi:uncharacterized protein (TIGR03118 family)
MIGILRSRLSAFLCATTMAIFVSSSPARAGSFAVTNLVTDDPSINQAQITDPSLVNPWGVSFSAASPFWVSNNGTGTSTLYSVSPTTGVVAKQGLVVTIPGAGNVTGQAFNGGSQFNGDRFLFVSEDGTISGWRGALGTVAEVLQTGTTDNVYKGSALATVGTDTYLYAANFRTGAIDVLKGSSLAPNLTGNFLDPNLPVGYAPFNIQLLDGKLYVTYALQDAAKSDDVAGAGHGVVNAFDTNGNLISRVASGGMPTSPLDSPWGLAIAPSNFGQFAGDLLVGNFGDGHISAYDLATNAFEGQLKGMDGNPLAIPGLWALTPGNDGSAGSSSKLYFTAGPDDESHGLFGSISSVPEPSTAVLVGTAAFGLVLLRKFSMRGR